MAELKRKVTLKRKGSPPEIKPKSKWWLLWLLLLLVLIVVAIFVFKKCSTTNNTVTSENPPVQVEQSVVPEQPSATDEAPVPENTIPANGETVVSKANEQPAEISQNGQPIAKPDNPDVTAPTLLQGTLEEKAQRVIRGDFGNGEERKQALGSEYNEIQQKVNEMYRNGEVY